MGMFKNLAFIISYRRKLRAKDKRDYVNKIPRRGVFSMKQGKFW